MNTFHYKSLSFQSFYSMVCMNKTILLRECPIKTDTCPKSNLCLLKMRLKIRSPLHLAHKLDFLSILILGLIGIIIYFDGFFLFVTGLVLIDSRITQVEYTQYGYITKQFLVSSR